MAIAETLIAVLLGLVIGGALAWWGKEIRELLARILNRSQGEVVRPLPPALRSNEPTILSDGSGVVKPISPKQAARENMEAARMR